MLALLSTPWIRMSIWNRFAAGSIAALVLAAPSSAADPAAALLGPGWQCLLVPTSFDGPGTIISVSNIGEKSRIVDLRAVKLITVQTGPAAFGKITDNRKISGDATVSLLEKAIPGLSGRLKAEGKHMSDVVTEFSDVREETTYEAHINPIVEKWFREHVKVKPGYRYFLVRDAYLAGRVNYKFTKQDIASLGGEAKFKTLFQAKGTLTPRDDSSGYLLDQKLDPALHVCIRAPEIVQTSGATAVVRYRVSDEAGQVPPISKSLDD